ncbi:MAG: dienelactone hydrolase family protein [Rhizobiaceae bacterium]
MQKSTLLTVLILILSTAITPVIAAESLSFAASSTYGGKKVNLNGELHLPATRIHKTSPVVILLHGCGGLDGAVLKSLRSHASALGRNGFASLILDSFQPRGISGGWVCKRNSRLASARYYRQRDIIDAITFISDNAALDKNNVFLMGQSNGGSTVASLTQTQKHSNIRAVVSYYPWCGAVPLRPKLPLYVFAGEIDEWTPPENCISNRPSSRNLKVKVYPETHHSFDLAIPIVNYQGHRLGGNPSATKDSRRRMIKFFKEHIKK